MVSAFLAVMNDVAVDIRARASACSCLQPSRGVPRRGAGGGHGALRFTSVALPGCSQSGSAVRSPPAPRFGFVLFLLLLLLPSRVGVRRYLAGIGLAFFLMTSSYFSRASGHLYVFLAEICTEICILCAFFKVVALWEFCV